MNFQKVTKIILAGTLALACAVTMFGCKKGKDGDKAQISDDGSLPNQYSNQRYYFQQGSRTDWDYKLKGEGGYYYNRDTGLVLELVPVKTTGEKDEKGFDIPVNPVEFIDGVEYCVYHYNNEDNIIGMTTSRNDIVNFLLDENSKLYFNNKFYLESPRETFRQVGEPESDTAQYSKLQFTRVAYTFTRDGEDWQGVYVVVASKKEFFVVTFEAKADLYETYEPAYKETIGDFRKEGWEES